MTKSRKPSTKKKKKTSTLAERIEALENQSFAQQLLIDELEKKLEQTEGALKNVWNQPINVPYQSPYGTQTHTCMAGVPDIYGAVTCIICGLQMYTITTTVSSDSTISLGTRISTSTETPVDDIDITWVIPNDTTRSG